MHHYVYRITNIIENRHYYGKRSSKLAPILDLGIKYFSSSKDTEFKLDQKNNRQKYRYKIIRTFETNEDAINFEIKLHHKMHVDKNHNFYNKSKQTSCSFTTSGITFSEKTRKKMSESAKRTNNGAKTTSKRAQSNRTNADARWSSFVQVIEKCNIDFSKYGWVKEVSKLLNISPQKVSRWMKRYCPEIYYNSCFKRTGGSTLNRTGNENLEDSYDFLFTIDPL